VATDKRLEERVRDFLTSKEYHPTAIDQLWEDFAEFGERELADVSGKLEQAQTENAELVEILEGERTKVSEGVASVRNAVIHRDWLTEGRGPYEWDDDRWHSEFAAAAKEILDALAPLAVIAGDLSKCPKDWRQVASARKDWKAELAALRLRLEQAQKDNFELQRSVIINAEAREVREHLRQVAWDIEEHCGEFDEEADW